MAMQRAIDLEQPGSTRRATMSACANFQVAGADAHCWAARAIANGDMKRAREYQHLASVMHHEMSCRLDRLIGHGNWI